MLKGIVAISGKPGLYKVLKRAKNALVVESIVTGKRTPTYPRDRVMSLADVSMYSDHGDVPLPDVLTALYALQEGKVVDVKGFADDDAVREFFGKVLPDYDKEHVYVTDMRKLFSWYNLLIAAGITEYKEKEETSAEEAAESAKTE